MIEPGQRQATLRYRTFWKRFWAGIIDGLVMFPVSVVLEPVMDPSNSRTPILVAGSIVMVAPWVYSVVMHAARGQTLGKMATGVKVLDVGERDIPSLGQAILRDIGYIVLSAIQIWYLSSLVSSGDYATSTSLGRDADVTLGLLATAWFVIEILTMLSNHKRRALHDFIARTVVVREPRR